MQFDQKYLDMNDLLARKDEEIARLKQELNSTGDSRREATAIRNDLLKLKVILPIACRVHSPS